MTSLALSQPTIWTRFQDVWKALVPSRGCATAPEDLREESRAERDYILEILDRNPDAFQSEMDIHNLARLYRCKF